MPRTFAGHINNYFVPFCCKQQNGTREVAVILSHTSMTFNELLIREESYCDQVLCKPLAHPLRGG